uniref:Uncharacterized protein n=1 Tax=uncultured marine virus TaxID=186617 RepID=A0A0F7L8P6_9VIRU|nr:hypothetical protein [uncultured marine virus]
MLTKGCLAINICCNVICKRSTIRHGSIRCYSKSTAIVGVEVHFISFSLNKDCRFC